MGRQKEILKLAEKKLCIRINLSSFVVCTISRLTPWIYNKYFDQSSNHAHSVKNARNVQKINLKNEDWSPLTLNNKVTGHIVKKVHNLISSGQGIPILRLYSYLSILVGKIWFTFFCFSVSLKQNLWS